MLYTKKFTKICTEKINYFDYHKATFIDKGKTKIKMNKIKGAYVWVPRIP